MNALGLIAGLLGFAAVALGAFGAHGLEGVLRAEGTDWWHTATLYALPHSVAALVISLHGNTGLLRKAGWAVWMLPLGEGSYEEIPTNLIDHLSREFHDTHFQFRIFINK